MQRYFRRDLPRFEVILLTSASHIILHVLSDLARQALSARDAATTRDGVPLFPVAAGANVVTAELVNRLRDEAP